MRTKNKVQSPSLVHPLQRDSSIVCTHWLFQTPGSLGYVITLGLMQFVFPLYYIKRPVVDIIWSVVWCSLSGRSSMRFVLPPRTWHVNSLWSEGLCCLRSEGLPQSEKGRGVAESRPMWYLTHVPNSPPCFLLGNNDPPIFKGRVCVLQEVIMPPQRLDPVSSRCPV